MVMDTEDYLKKVGQNIRTIRKKKGITIKELGLECEIEKSNLIPIEQGKKNVTIKTLMKISNSLGVSVKDLLPND